MEFENLGKHCEVKTCHQKDFLPFKCDVCKLTLCLTHRPYAAHNCAGDQAKDMTSVDCPVCGRGIRLTRCDDADLIWETHFNTECTQQPRNNKSDVKKCCAQDCIHKLGPSNTFQCPKCFRKVCLSHRIPEDHQCSSLIKHKGIATRHSSTNKNSSSNLTNKSEVTSSDTSSNIMNQKQSSTSSNTQFLCPFCSIDCHDQELLMSHVNFEHNESTSPSSSTPSTAGRMAQQSNSRSEVCPQCQERFNDPIALVDHVERVHSHKKSSNCVVT
mmetsp:Transcript_37408/g.38092  ORF Transcript_37408/g.38092 Transcript_37408/m.38092 type:complete len:271 (-) Transcript_37408:131-943(-)